MPHGWEGNRRSDVALSLCHGLSGLSTCARPQNDLYCVGWDVKPYSLTLTPAGLTATER